MERKQIHVLDEHMINLIAAGEVVERAASVVKELVENSIDAGATQINVSLVDSGLKEITVSDNGCGMDEQNIKLAILPHATSKIQKETDLFSIATLGFRGEALASILAVSQTKIKSSTGTGKGVMLGIKAGIVTSEAYIGFPKGTEIQVRNLFFNTPARLQNLKSESVELGYISDFVTKIALANPGISFKLYNNEKLLFQSYGTGNMLEAISNVYDVDVAKNMVSVSGDTGLFKIYGFTSNLQVTKSSKNNITIIVNGRVVRNNSIINAIIDGYKTLLTVGRFPITVLEILVDYSLVDVNVHPTKSEIRFSDEANLKELISSSINNSLLNTNLIINNDSNNEDNDPWKAIEDENEDEGVLNEANDRIPVIHEIKSSEIDFEADFSKNNEENGENEEEISEIEENYEEDNIQESLEKADKAIDDFEDLPEFLKEFESQFASNNDELSFEDKEVSLELIDENDIEVDENEEESKEVIEQKPVQLEINFIDNSIDGNNKFQINKLYYIGQLFNTYILAQNEEGFYIIDQHAANERINYEKILKELENEDVVSFELAVPIKLSFTIQESLLIKEKLDDLSYLGIELEDFGGGTFIVRMVPVWMSKANTEEYVESVITQVINNKKTDKIEFLDNMAKSMACKKSIKGNEYVSGTQVDALLNDLVKCKNPFTCPHGRPIVVKYSKSEIEKWFKRINN